MYVEMLTCLTPLWVCWYSSLSYMIVVLDISYFVLYYMYLCYFHSRKCLMLATTVFKIISTHLIELMNLQHYESLRFHKEGRFTFSFTIILIHVGIRWYYSNFMIPSVSSMRDFSMSKVFIITDLLGTRKMDWVVSLSAK